MISKHRGTGATLISPRRSVRFFEFSNWHHNVENRNPGPGRYNDVQPLSDRGHYPISSSAGYGKRFFDKERRISKIEDQAIKNFNPGPGNYRYPSEFGNYDGDIYSSDVYKTKPNFSTINRTSDIRLSRRKIWAIVIFNNRFKVYI